MQQFSPAASVRPALFMAALASMRRYPLIHSFCERLRQRGKARAVALVACMRKLLVRELCALDQ